ncbi:MAG: ATP-dependent metallopeptidase FtsH/Yme1/Tma family protein [Campylobacterales bacterium]|nr:ATP-dependent metallopeptidase FtsH/Yme1/Tma family protein [Campylobacterales bacterium]
MKQTLQRFKFIKILIIFSAFMITALLSFAFLRENAKPIDLHTYNMLKKNDKILEAYIQEPFLYIKTDTQTYKIIQQAIDLKELSQSVAIDVRETKNLTDDIVNIAILAILIFFVLLIFRGVKKEQEKADNIQNEQKKIFAVQSNQIESLTQDIFPQKSDIKFEDVAGIEEVKEELVEIIDFLKNPTLYKDFGAKMPKGVLLVGPPGVGKTMIAKAVAGEAGVPFFYHSGSSFVQIYAGVGPKRVRELFSKAKSVAPSIIFIDEIDAVGKARGGFRNDEREATLNQLLTSMDGFEDSSGVIVIAATNKIDMLDDALLRSGRFDRRVYISLPNFEERVKVLEVHLKNINHSIDIEKVSKFCVGFSGASLASLANEAVLNAIRRHSNIVEFEDFLAVKDKVLLGKRKKLSFSEDERKIVSTYQAAKALTAYWLDIDFDKMGLLSDGFKEIDSELNSKTQMLSKIKVCLAGISAVELIFKDFYTFGADDLETAKNIAIEMVERYGMGNRLYPNPADVSSIIEECKLEIKEFLNGYIATLNVISDYINEHEAISKKAIGEMIQDVF